MTKAITTSFGATVLGTTYYGSLFNSSMLSFILDTHHRATIIRASLALLICLYCFVSTFRRRISKYLMIGLGFGLLYVGFTGMLTSQFSNMFNYYILPIDIFFAIEGGVIALLLGIELPLATRHTQFTLQPTMQPLKKKIRALSAKTASVN